MAFPLGRASYYKTSMRVKYLPLYWGELTENCYLNKYQQAKLIGFINDYANFLSMFGDILNVDKLKLYFKYLYTADLCKTWKPVNLISNNLLDRVYNILAREHWEYAYDYITSIIKIDKDLYIFSIKE